jgi:hypothetical protein
MRFLDYLRKKTIKLSFDKNYKKNCNSEIIFYKKIIVKMG